MPDCCNPQFPSSFPRRVLVSTLGLAPQVLTETLYCLAKTHPEPFIPTQIHIITTAEGAHRAKLTLLDPSQAKLSALAKDHAIPGLSNALSRETLHVISSGDGQFLDDIDCAEDNAATADIITGLIRELAQDKECALHVSIAGGRKTMGFLLGYALSLFGRPQDRLSHVLVSKPFQDHPDFFFPPSQPVVLRDRDNRPVSTADANVILADIPVVHLREHLPEALLSGGASYSDTVTQAQRMFSPARMIIDTVNCTIFCQDTPVKLPPATFAFAAWMARCQKDGNQTVHWQTSDWNGYAREYAAIPNISAELSARTCSRFSKANIRGQLDQDRKGFFQEHLSRLRKAIKDQLGPLQKNYIPVTKRSKIHPGAKFPLEAGMIRFVR